MFSASVDVTVSVMGQFFSQSSEGHNIACLEMSQIKNGPTIGIASWLDAEASFVSPYCPVMSLSAERNCR
jgi:hypothetical protein